MISSKWPIHLEKKQDIINGSIKSLAQMIHLKRVSFRTKHALFSFATIFDSTIQQNLNIILSLLTLVFV